MCFTKDRDENSEGRMSHNEKYDYTREIKIYLETEGYAVTEKGNVNGKGKERMYLSRTNTSTRLRTDIG